MKLFRKATNLILKAYRRYPYNDVLVVCQTHLCTFKSPFNIIQCFVRPDGFLDPSTYLVSSRKPMYKAVIFDKDGTIICFNSMWIPWARTIAKNISSDISRDIGFEILTTLGCCPKTHIINPGVLAEGTEEQVIIALTNLLVSHGITKSMAQSIVSKHVKALSLSPEHVVQLTDMKSMLTTLRQHSIKTAICTSDSRKGTVQALAVLDVLHLLDVIVCGDDPGRLPKPHPDNAEFICRELHVSPEETVMIGDTSTDIAFAKNANLGLCIGVLSGIGQQNGLEETWLKHSEIEGKSNLNEVKSYHSKPKLHIVPSVGHILPIVLPDLNLPIRQILLGNNVLHQKLSNQKFKLVIIDKDGSFINVHPRWAEWCEKVYIRLSEKTSPDLACTFLSILGYSSETRKISNGILAGGSTVFIEECLRYLLILKGYGVKESDQIVNQIWICPSSIPGITISDTVETVKKLREIGLQVAINSSDSRKACDDFLLNLKLHDYINIIVSAEDAGCHPKPLPHTVLQIIDKVGCKPEETVIVGDTPADLMSGRSAKVGLTVGLLSGFSSATDLISYSDLILPNLSHLPNIFID
ncbi:unnamed protein product [Schistosoma curassoni]|nr:unnamed protein product [Schistosoma curassoni]